MVVRAGRRAPPVFYVQGRAGHCSPDGDAPREAGGFGRSLPGPMEQGRAGDYSPDGGREKSANCSYGERHWNLYFPHCQVLTLSLEFGTK